MDSDKILVHLGGDGVPFMTRRDGIPNYKNALPGRLRPQAIRRVRVDVLDLCDKGDYDYYLKVWDAVGLGIVTVVEEDKQWVPSKENWKVFIRWYMHGQMDPSELRTTRLETAQAMVNSGIDQGERQ